MRKNRGKSSRKQMTAMAPPAARKGEMMGRGRKLKGRRRFFLKNTNRFRFFFPYCHSEKTILTITLWAKPDRIRCGDVFNFGKRRRYRWRRGDDSHTSSSSTREGSLEWKEEHLTPLPPPPLSILLFGKARGLFLRKERREEEEDERERER